MNEIGNQWAIAVQRHLATARRAQGRSQDAIARAVGVTQASISNYEAGKRIAELGTVLAWCHALDLSLTNVLGDAGGALANGRA